MDERQLKELMGAQEIPSADENARKEAINLALAAFDEAQHEKKESRQGIGFLGRLTGRFKPDAGERPMMKKKFMYGGLVTTAVLVIAVSVSYNTIISPDFETQYSLPKKPTETGVKDLRENIQKKTDATSGGRQAGDKANEPKTQSGAAATGRVSQATENELRAKEKSSATTQQRPMTVGKLADRLASQERDAAQQTQPSHATRPSQSRSDDKTELKAQTGPAAAPPVSTVRKRPAEKFVWDRNVGHILGQQAGAKRRAEQAARRPAPDHARQHYQDVGRDQFENVVQNAVKRVADEPVSTFSSDVDTASYAFMRRELNRGRLPQKSAVRVEELINYFHYDYALPDGRARPFAPNVTVTDSPWKKGNKLIHIGIKGYDIDTDQKPRSNLVFLLDVSGSMRAPDKLPLMVNSMKLLLNTLSADDTVAIVVYAGAAGTVLEPTKVSQKHRILAALDRLSAGGSTAGAQGVRQAYALAEGNFDKKAVNRVILATDGDFNVGITNRNELKGYIERKRKSGIFLSVLGFGQGNLNDHLMQTLAQNGNGVAAHIDTLSEARKVLVDEASSTLFPIAKDVKVQVEFNPKTVAEYRLIGYETRALKRQDFANDKVDAGDIGAGHTVTAIYEITPVGSGNQLIGASRYAQAEKKAGSKTDFGNEYAFLKIRYKLPKEDKSKLITRPITKRDERDADAKSDRQLREAAWATAVAGFGQLLKGGKYTGSYSYDDVIKLARSAKGDDPFGYRGEFINLVRLARSSGSMQTK